ncbi:WecB/TagA/CpsF family glycosyltransferase [Bacillus sp. FJAT-27445]|uniref:WecB/TagA/CpsF family glycosyltransferase n=1 Tax=Bacillus sp. FJAT-27445 TaxID=1679166 RepID=UPI00074394A1|nr:WecB/TagA/CpsF family glycosyltransferase [Bacillus sp. FJAT-27445]
MTWIFSLEISDKDFSETTEFISKRLAAPGTGPFHVMTVNAEIAGKVLRDPQLKHLANEADLLTPDGAGILVASKLAGTPLKERVTGYDLLWSLLKANKGKPMRVFLLGSRERTVHSAASKLAAGFPEFSFAYHHGYFSEEEEDGIVRRINDFAPDLLFVGMGFPSQDAFIHAYKPRLNAKVVMGVGGSFDVISGNEKRAPLFFQKTGLEWAYRILVNPLRIKKTLHLFSFGWKVLTAAMQKKRTVPVIPWKILFHRWESELFKANARKIHEKTVERSSQ